jgi:pyridoxine 5'-phosphate synthase PdxJ
MQDLFQNYMDDVSKFRESFHNELAATADELTKAMGLYAARSEAALASFMEKVSKRGVELETAAAMRFNLFRGLAANAGLSEGDGGQIASSPAQSDKARIATAAEQAVAAGLQIESGDDRKPSQARSIALVKTDPIEPAA